MLSYECVCALMCALPYVCALICALSCLFSVCVYLGPFARIKQTWDATSCTLCLQFAATSPATLVVCGKEQHESGLQVMWSWRDPVTDLLVTRSALAGQHFSVLKTIGGRNRQ